jgi:hypothetical protein
MFVYFSAKSGEEATNRLHWNGEIGPPNVGSSLTEKPAPPAPQPARAVADRQGSSLKIGKASSHLQSDLNWYERINL